MRRNLSFAEFPNTLPKKLVLWTEVEVQFFFTQLSKVYSKNIEAFNMSAHGLKFFFPVASLLDVCSKGLYVVPRCPDDSRDSSLHPS
jgi:hypothetical protein